jgi:hypothetical protein
MERIAERKGGKNDARNFFFIFDKMRKNFLHLDEILQGVDEIVALNYPFESLKDLKEKIKK